MGISACDREERVAANSVIGKDFGMLKTPRRIVSSGICCSVDMDQLGEPSSYPPAFYCTL